MSSPKKGDAAGVFVKGVEVRGGGVVVNKRVLGRALGQLGAEFFGVRVCIKAMSSMLGMWRTVRPARPNRSAGSDGL